MKNKFEIPTQIKKQSFQELVDYVYKQVTSDLLTKEINADLASYTKNPYYCYSRLSNEYPLYKSDEINVALQTRPKNLQQNKTLINTLAMDISFKVLSGKMEIITYERTGNHISEINRYELSTGQHALFERDKDIVEFHPIQGEDVVLLVCQGPIINQTTECFDINTKMLTRRFSTQTKESRLRIYSDVLIQSGVYKKNNILEKVFSLAQTSELRWSILKSLKNKDLYLMSKLLDKVPKHDCHYQTSLQLKKVMQNAHS